MEGSWILIYIYIYRAHPSPLGLAARRARTYHPPLFHPLRASHFSTPFRPFRRRGGRGLRIAKVKLTRRQLVRASEIRSSGIAIFSLPLLLEDAISPFKDAAVDRRRGFFLFFPFSFLEKGSETVFVREREKRRRRRVVADRIHAVLRSFATLVRYERHLRSALARDFSSDEGREESEDRVNRRIYSPELFAGGEGQILSIYDRGERTRNAKKIHDQSDQ